MIRRLFGTMLGQILAINAGASALTFLLVLVLLLTRHPPIPPPPPWPWPDAFRIAALIESVHAVPLADRPLIATAATGRGLSVRLTPSAVLCTGLRPEAQGMRAVLDAELRSLSMYTAVHSCDDAGSNRPGDVQVLAVIDDQILEIRTERVSPQPAPRFSLVTLPFIGTLLFLSVAVACMSAWALSRVIGPLRRLAEKANNFDHQIAVAPIREEGPQEIRLATRAFNLMQERIARSVRDRTRMLAAISHDLRTPLTRMRLQLETGQMNVARDRLIRDVDLMQSMVASALAFLSGIFDREEKEWLDLGALLSTLCDEFEEGGLAIRYEGPEQIHFLCRPNAVTRAVTNLIENGSQFGDKITVSATIEKHNTIIIDVADDGPGIPSQYLADVIEPFVRLDPIRLNRAGNVGLGLSIVREIAQSHSGTLTLINRQPHGLSARLTLPRDEFASQGEGRVG